MVNRARTSWSDAGYGNELRDFGFCGWDLGGVITLTVRESIEAISSAVSECTTNIFALDTGLSSGETRVCYI